MESKIAQAIKARHQPIAILLSDDKPEGAAQFSEGKWGCVMWLLAGAIKGKTAAMDERSFGCLGGGTGLGFGNQYEKWPGGIECFYFFLSTGNKRRGAQGEELAEQVRSSMRRESFEHFVHGERYLKSPEVTKKFVESLPMTQISTRYVIFKPLAQVDLDREEPSSVLFLVNPDRLSALVRNALESGKISLSRAAEILGLDAAAMRQRVASWELVA